MEINRGAFPRVLGFILKGPLPQKILIKVEVPVLSKKRYLYEVFGLYPSTDLSAMSDKACVDEHVPLET